MTRPLRRAACSTLALLLGACVSIGPSGDDLPPRLALDAGPPRDDQAEPLGVTISVADPSADKVFNTSGVAVQTAPLQYEYLSGAEWTDRAPLLLGRFLERSFENTNRFSATGDPITLPVSDYTLLTDIRAFHLDRTGGGAGEAVVGYGARLNDRRGRTLGTRPFRAEVPIGANGNDATVTALNEAARRAASETVAWSVELIRRAEAADGAAGS